MLAILLANSEERSSRHSWGEGLPRLHRAMNPRHRELFSVLVELYNLQVQLGNIAPSALIIPTDAVFNRDAALQAGYTEEAVKVMSNLPYLSSEEDGFEVFPSTFVERYAEEPNEDVYAYQVLRALDNEPFEGVYIPPSYIRLTRQNTCGSVFLYDTDTGIFVLLLRRSAVDVGAAADYVQNAGLVRHWRPFDDGIDKYNNNLHLLPAKTPTEVFGPWIDSYRKLKIFKYTDFITCWEPDEPIGNYDPAVAPKREKLRLAELKIRDFYLHNGWKVDAKDQDGFNLKRFIEQRDAYRERVLYPLFDDVGSRQMEAGE
ncbi:hypothetical protein PWT90_07706 [Aphanocladium album]|nr:hypothetical protein PWT90_07706 [Aphanocladium album]